MIASDTSQDSPDPSDDESAEAMQTNPGIGESNSTSTSEDSGTPEAAQIETAEEPDTPEGVEEQAEQEDPAPAEEATIPAAASQGLGEDPPFEAHSDELPDDTPASHVSTVIPDHLPQDAAQDPSQTPPPGDVPGAVPSEQDTAEDLLSEAAVEEESATPEHTQTFGNPTTAQSVSVDSGSVSKPWAKEKTAQNGYPEELNSAFKELRHWNSLHAWFVGGLRATIWLIEDLLSRSEKSQSDWPPELTEKLKTRHQGLVLTGKILRRSSEKCDCLSLLGEGAFPNIETEPISDRQWEEVLDKLQAAESASEFELLHQHLSSARDAVLSGIKKSTTQDQKQLLELVQKSVLPVIDGLDDGEMGTESLIDSLTKDFPDHCDSLEDWFGTYQKMRSTLLELLTGVGIEQMDVVSNTPVDYERHEPFDVEESLEFDDESILSLSRNGYEFPKAEDVPWKIVRPAQVIVAKKPRESSN